MAVSLKEFKNELLEQHCEEFSFEKVLFSCYNYNMF